MELTKASFSILDACRKQAHTSQRALAQAAGLSIGNVNSALRACRDAGYIDGMSLTDKGLEALAPYRVDNAIIMAAGLSSRFAPISYERPKGVLRVRGEVLIERQIAQLQQAGITDITVVVGYMKEEFFYLADKMGVSIIINSEYAQRNNNSSLFKVREKLGNTYICSSDDYFTENVFEPYVYQAYYPGVFVEGATDEYCLQVGGRNRIVGVTVGGADVWCMFGQAYFDRAFSKRFVDILEDEYDLPETRQKLWEDIFRDHVRELDMVMRPYGPDVIHEFDSLDELRKFDPEFIVNVDSEILDNITSVLDCSKVDIRAIVPISKGLTNMSFRFDVDGSSYVYRHPGAGTDEIINRTSEEHSEHVAQELGLDDTFVYEDGQRGWKISRYIPDCVPFDYHDRRHVSQALGMARRLHEKGQGDPAWTFDIYEEADKIVDLLSERYRTTFEDFNELHEQTDRLYGCVRADGVPYCLCHNDFYDPNLLVCGDKMYLIDWEYSGMSDYASDLGTFICCSDYTRDEATDVISTYFGREPTPEELRHCIAYVAISAYYWFVWAIYKESVGNSVGDYLYLWYRFTKTYGMKALELYGRPGVFDTAPSAH